MKIEAKKSYNIRKGGTTTLKANGGDHFPFSGFVAGVGEITWTIEGYHYCAENLSEYDLISEVI